jgi:hypothetical protein
VALFDGEEIGLQGSQYYASRLIPPGPAGKYVLAANMDQNGFEYPAYPEGTTSSTWTPGPWFTNINASPIKDFSIYGPNASTPPPAIAANMPAILHFRQVLSGVVQEAFAKLGAKYHDSIALNNPPSTDAPSLPTTRLTSPSTHRSRTTPSAAPIRSRSLRLASRASGC